MIKEISRNGVPYVLVCKCGHRKTIGIEVTLDRKIIVRFPYRLPLHEVNRFIEEKYDWILASIDKCEKRREEKIVKENNISFLTNGEVEELARQALRDIPERLRKYAPLIGVTYGRVTIRNQKTRWGSCSSKGNLNFNCLLMLTPEYVRDYVVIHELCHRKEMNHSPRFWALVQSAMPDYDVANRWLKKNGSDIIARLPR